MTSIDELPGLLVSTVVALSDAGVHDEALGAFKPSRGVLIFRTADAFAPVGRAWRLGVLLLDRSGGLYSLGEVTRAVAPGRAAVNRSAAGTERRSYREAASRSAFPAGEAVNFGFAPLALDAASLAAGSGPLFLLDGQIMVTVDPASGGATDLERYLADRVAALMGD
ncbi:MAG: hypothetical protein QOH44_1146 [Actinomycetota bacterium]|nr:hypothetical protein [Actinomycetota bacterium]